MEKDLCLWLCALKTKNGRKRGRDGINYAAEKILADKMLIFWYWPEEARDDPHRRMHVVLYSCTYCGERSYNSLEISRQRTTYLTLLPTKSAIFLLSHSFGIFGNC